ncbi:MAG: PilZ domain-containing protein [Planctomycetes bacterium]|nr:PilZ domain-containing protein [Planctomycetota bacterium]MCH7601437.1 PilZ domain-containing protein [Planctomycetota bacterium]
MFPNHYKPGTSSSENDQRADRRVRQSSLQSSVGRVHDISETGMRVVCRRELKGVVEVAIVDGANHIVVKASVVWIRRIGFDRYFAGLVFEDLLPEERNRIRGVIKAESQNRPENEQKESLAA